MKTQNVNYHHDNVVTRTIYSYYLERRKEYRLLCIQYNTCTDINLRRLMRKRKEELLLILSRDTLVTKTSITASLKIKYKDIVPEMVNIKKKVELIRNQLLWQNKQIQLSK